MEYKVGSDITLSFKADINGKNARVMSATVDVYAPDKALNVYHDLCETKGNEVNYTLDKDRVIKPGQYVFIFHTRVVKYGDIDCKKIIEVKSL